MPAPLMKASRPVREDLVLQASLEAYGAIRHEGRLADRALEFTLRRKKHLYSNERRAVAERVYALLRQERTVEFLAHHALGDFSKLSLTEKDAFKFATSRVLQGEPTEDVARTSQLRQPQAQALYKLPAAAAALEKLPRLQRFALSASLPDFLAERFIQELGDDAERAAEAMNERAPLNIRTNTLKTDREALIARLRDEGVEAKPGKLSPTSILIDARKNAFSLESFREGLFELQDEGSQLLGQIVDAPPTKVVDTCAGSGGKTLQLCAQMKNRGELFALDIDEPRLEELRRRARRAGAHNVRVRPIAADESALEALKDLEGKADRVLVDAPCSGTGTLRRKPDARYRLTPDMLEDHVRRQHALIRKFSTLVKPGGRLIYGTCSILREENESVVESFLAENPTFHLEPVTRWLPGIPDNAIRNGCLRLLTHLHGTDGFFGAVLVRAK